MATTSIFRVLPLCGALFLPLIFNIFVVVFVVVTLLNMLLLTNKQTNKNAFKR